MRLLRKFAQLDSADRMLLAEAAIAVPLIRIGLTILPFRIVHRGVVIATRRLHELAGSESRKAERISWAISAVAARVPRASCLTQAVAATLLLARHGHDATLRLGVARNDDGALRAHAWLESGGRMLLGEPAAGAFTAFPPVVFTQR